MTVDSRKKKKKTVKTDENTVAVVPVAAPSGGFCTADQCSFAPPSHPVTMSSEPLVTVAAASDAMHPLINESMPINHEGSGESSLAALFPDELYDLMKTAAISGALVSLLLTLSEEVLTTYLTAKGYTGKQIYWANQSIRALMLLGAGASIETVISLPLANYLMTDHLKFKPTTAHALGSGLSIAIGICKSPLSVIETSATIATAIASSLVSSTLTRSAYSSIRNSRFFSSTHPHAEAERETSLPRLAHQ